MDLWTQWEKKVRKIEKVALTYIYIITCKLDN